MSFQSLNEGFKAAFAISSRFVVAIRGAHLIALPKSPQPKLPESTASLAISTPDLGAQRPVDWLRHRQVERFLRRVQYNCRARPRCTQPPLQLFHQDAV